MTQHICPLCGNPWEVPQDLDLLATGIVWRGNTIPMSPLTYRLFLALFKARGTPIADGRLHHILYGDRIDGGPEIQNIKVRISHLRSVLARHDLPFQIKRATKEYKSIISEGGYVLLEVKDGRSAPEYSQTIHP